MSRETGLGEWGSPLANQTNKDVSVYVASTQTVICNFGLDQAAPLTALISAAALLWKMHVNIFVIYFPAEIQQLQQFLREFSDTSHFLSVLGTIDCTHTFLLG